MALKSNVVKFPARKTSPIELGAGGTGSVRIELADAMNCYSRWPSPIAIVADGPYGLNKFPGDPKSPDDLAAWYAPHIAEWSRLSSPETTLWFWCSEVGWAEVHPVLKTHGWNYKAAHIWDKGIGHIAGNCNGDTIRGLRKSKELTLKQMSRRTGLRISLLSQIERAESSPPISSLYKIAMALETKIQDLFGDN